LVLIYGEILAAANRWWIDRKQKDVHHFILRNVPFLFEVIGALYLETRKLPLQSVNKIPPRKIDQDYVFTIGMFLQSDEYAILRSILSLIGDIYNLTTPLLNLKNGYLLELEDSVKKLFDYANRFREARNFFTHLDEVLTNMDKHGITGAANTGCGIQYTNKARGCIHLVWNSDENTIHFTYQGKAQKIRIEKSVFDPIFVTARDMYLELVVHEKNADQKIHQTVEDLFKLR
jgi:hypothetical protein